MYANFIGYRSTFFSVEKKIQTYARLHLSAETIKPIHKSAYMFAPVGGFVIYSLFSKLATTTISSIKHPSIRQ